MEARAKGRGQGAGLRDRREETLFVDARNLGSMVDRTHRELMDEDLAKIAGTYHAWRGDEDAGSYADVPGFCKAAKLDDIRKHGHVLTPGRYVGVAPEKQEDDFDFEEALRAIHVDLKGLNDEAVELAARIARSFEELGA